MERIGFITKILPDNKCKVLVSRISGCKGNCKTCGGCPTPEVHIEMENTVDAKRGDYVKIGVDSKIILRRISTYTFYFVNNFIKCIFSKT